jgi:hypothetical protein
LIRSNKPWSRHVGAPAELRQFRFGPRRDHCEAMEEQLRQSAATELAEFDAVLADAFHRLRRKAAPIPTLARSRSNLSNRSPPLYRPPPQSRLPPARPPAQDNALKIT